MVPLNNYLRHKNEVGRQGGREGGGREGGRQAGREEEREEEKQGRRQGGREGGRKGGREGGRDGGREGGREGGIKHNHKTHLRLSADTTVSIIASSSSLKGGKQQVHKRSSKPLVLIINLVYFLSV